MKSLRDMILSVRRPTDIQDSHLASLNIHLDQDVPLTDFVPADQFTSRPLLYDSDLSSMLAELGFDNQDAFREILRQPPLEGRKKPRLAYSRNFYTSLEDMSRYWDDTEDQYYMVEDQGKEDDKPGGASDKPNPEKRDLQARPGGAGEPDSVTSAPVMEASTPGPRMKEVYKGNRLGNGEQMSPGTRVAAVRNLLKMVIHKFNCRDYEVAPRERLRIRNVNLPMVQYNFCVAKVPADMKLARARMVEGPMIAVYARNEVRFKSREGLLTPSSDFFGERFDLFREIGCLLMLAMQRTREGKKQRPPDEKEQWWAVRPRWGGGETRWGQLANEVYEDEDPSWSPLERRLQLEKRDREEKERKKALELRAATANEKDVEGGRGGGGEDLMATAERPKKKKRAGGESSPVNGAEKDKSEWRDGRRLMYVPPMRRRWYHDWVKIRPNTPTWDEKIIYKRIGRQQQHQQQEADGKEADAGGFDDVYLVSSVNHHVCLVKLSVHEKYLEWLDTGKTVQEDEHGGRSDDSWSKNVKGKPPPKKHNLLYVSRSPWFDLFDVHQRQEFLLGLWRLMCWVARDDVPQVEYQKMEQQRQQQHP